MSTQDQARSRMRHDAYFLKNWSAALREAPLAGDIRLQPRDLLFEEFDPLLQLPHREQRQILPDLVGDLFLRTVVVVEGWHRLASRLRIRQT